MADGQNVTETGDAQPWWRTSGDDGDPIARLLEEPGAETQAGNEAGALETGAPGKAPASDRRQATARQPFSTLTVAVVAGFLAIVLVLVAALSAGRDRRDGGPSQLPTPNGTWPDGPAATTCRAAHGCRPGAPAAVSVGGEPAGGAAGTGS